MKEPINQYDENNQFHGLWERTNKKGRIYSITNYLHGVHHGRAKLWWSNGQIAQEGYYKNGKHDGLWLFFTKEKRLKVKTYYI